MFSVVNNHGKAVTAFQIQLTTSADTGYASPIWSSGDITDMISTANAARTPDIPYGIGNAPTSLLQGGGSYIWRIRTKSGFYSDWSSNGTIGMAASGSFTARFYEDKDTYYGDTYTKGGSPDADQLVYGGWGDSYYDYLQWTNIDTLGPSAADTTATNFYIYGNGLKPSNPNIYVKVITASWDEENLWINNNPTTTDTDQVLMVNPPAGYFATTVTTIYTKWKNGTNTNYGVKLHPTTTDGESNGQFRSSDYAWYDSDPYLEVSYTPPNNPPTVVLNTPTDTQTITDTTPTVEFTGTDTEANDIEYNVQIDTVDTFDSQSSGWDVSTASYASKSYNVSAQDGNPKGLTFSSDGTKMYVVGWSNDTVYQYTLSTAWDVSTASYASKSYSVTTQEPDPMCLTFSSDGTKMYVVGYTNDTTYQYTLSTAWDVSTASYASKSYSVAAQDNYPYGLTFSSDGTKMYIMGYNNDTVYQYTL
ncbi:MAG: hypothetical protein COX15_00695, partial [Candidatus Colwellbacteria bacterium CG23_combo_of_CG06-09_8_20_14_all_42_19]